MKVLFLLFFSVYPIIYVCLNLVHCKYLSAYQLVSFLLTTFKTNSSFGLPGGSIIAGFYNGNLEEGDQISC